MAKITYSPNGHFGYICQVVSAAGKLMRITRLEIDDDPVSDGDGVLSQNKSLVRRLDAYANNELAYRRARGTHQKAALRKQADVHRKIALDLADLIDLVGDETTCGWCSGCLEKEEHRWAQRRSLTPDTYLCDGCGAVTTPCLWPGCEHFALRKPGAIQFGKYCAEHAHVIPGFEKLDMQFDSLDDYDSWLEFESRDAKRMTALTGGAVGGGLVVAPLFLAAAPVIGGAIGTLGGLSGAAAASHGLALLGGGAVAAGGLGMAGGTAVVAATGAALGGKVGASVASAYVGDDPSFAIEVLQRGEGPTVVFASGFLSEDEAGWGEWETIIRRGYPNSTVFRLRWGAKEQADLRALFIREAGAKLAIGGLVKAGAKASRLALKKIGLIGGVLSVSELAKNPWSVARTRANMTGAVLADLIARTHTSNYVLVGHSLGARVMLSAAEALGSRGSNPQLDSVHLLGAAVSAGHNLTNVGRAVSDTVWNYWSSNDETLAKLYLRVQFGERAAGAVGFTTTHPNVKNRNVSRQVTAHSMFVPNVTLR